MFAETGYLLDPHTAVAWEVAERLRERDPVLVVSTAHWAKFGGDVYKALAELPYDEVLPDGVRELSASSCSPRYRSWRAREHVCPARSPSSTSAPSASPNVVNAGRDGVESAVRSWLAG